jgi:hypothetical protein
MSANGLGSSDVGLSVTIAPGGSAHSAHRLAVGVTEAVEVSANFGSLAGATSVGHTSSGNASVRPW